MRIVAVRMAVDLDAAVPATNCSTFQPERLISVAARISQRTDSGLPSAPTVSKYRYE